MSIPKIRKGNYIPLRITKEETGSNSSWMSGNINAPVIRINFYSEAQNVGAGCFPGYVSEEDPSVLVGAYGVNQPQFLGAYSLSVEIERDNRIVTFISSTVFEIVETTAEEAWNRQPLAISVH